MSIVYHQLNGIHFLSVRVHMQTICSLDLAVKLAVSWLPFAINLLCFLQLDVLEYVLPSFANCAVKFLHARCCCAFLITARSSMMSVRLSEKTDVIVEKGSAASLLPLGELDNVFFLYY